METLAMNIEPGSGRTAQEIAAATDTLRSTLRGEVLTEANAGLRGTTPPARSGTP
jgi:hypothetical protein